MDNLDFNPPEGYEDVFDTGGEYKLMIIPDDGQPRFYEGRIIALIREKELVKEDHGGDWQNLDATGREKIVLLCNNDD